MSDGAENEWDIELNTRGAVLYLRAPTYYSLQKEDLHERRW